MAEELTFAEMEANIKRNLSRSLVKTFEEIAKIAMRAASDFSTEVENKSVIERLQNAHSVIALIIDDGMRGLGQATTLAMGFAAVTTMKGYEEPDESSPH